MIGLASGFGHLRGSQDLILHKFDLTLHKLYKFGNSSTSSVQELHKNVIKSYIFSKYIYNRSRFSKPLKIKDPVYFT